MKTYLREVEVQYRSVDPDHDGTEVVRTTMRLPYLARGMVIEVSRDVTLRVEEIVVQGSSETVVAACSVLLRSPRL